MPTKHLLICYVQTEVHLQGNQAEPEASKPNTTPNQDHLKRAMPGSPSSDDGVSIDDQSDDESASSGDEVDDMTAESDLKPYIFSSDGEDVCKLDSCNALSPVS